MRVIRIIISRGDSFTRCLQLTRFRRWHKKKEVLTRISRSVESENCSTPHSPPPPLNTFYIFSIEPVIKQLRAPRYFFFVFQLLSRRKRSAEKVTLYIREHRLTWLHLFRVFSESKRNKCSKHRDLSNFPEWLKMPKNLRLFPFQFSFSLFGSRQTAFNGDQVEVETLEFLFGCSDIELAVLATW